MLTKAGTVTTGVVGAPTTVTVVVAVLATSSVEVAVMVTVPAVAGAVQAPVLALMLPPVADQVMPLVAPLEAVALKVVVELAVRVPPTGLMAPTATVCTVMGRLVVAVLPAALVTVRVKVLAAVMVPLLKATPLVTVPTPLSTLPVPLLKEGVMRVVPA